MRDRNLLTVYSTFTVPQSAVQCAGEPSRASDALHRRFFRRGSQPGQSETRTGVDRRSIADGVARMESTPEWVRGGKFKVYRLYRAI